MAAARGKRGTARAGRRTTREPDSGAQGESARIVPDLLRRALGFGFSGFFTTEELLRKAFGDSVPREWVEFAATQTERARRDFAERIAGELRRSLDAIDLEQLAERMLRDHTIEIDARIRFVRKEPGDARASDLRIRVSDDRAGDPDGESS
ncbi:MAG: hypothetical protein DCC71_16840 [Proteobacteria bacterium]|nr:MAG: hypothetical protein DCC71_16840 [Pseudomonadota bacterium]